MKEINQYIHNKQVNLEEHPFCLWLKNQSNDVHSVNLQHEVFPFVPSMAFFVLGFRDLLRTIKVDNPKTSIEKMINHHCDEDINHWHWYLQDLEKLGFKLDFWGSHVSDVLKQIWGDENESTRDLTYNIMHKIKSSPSSEITLVVIEVLESAFAAFIGGMSVQTKSLNIYDKLNYFGKNHVDSENSHDMGSWLEEDNLDDSIEHIILTESDKKLSCQIIDELFIGFDKMFSCWKKTALVEQNIPLQKNMNIPSSSLSL